MRFLSILLTFCALLSFSAVAQISNCESTVATPARANDTLPVFSAETMARFNNEDGAKAFKAWCMSHVRYPIICQENGIQGRVYLSFIIEKDGKLTNAKIVRGCNKDLDSAALGVVKRAPNLWKPATNNGQPVRLFLFMPFDFILK